MPQMMPMNWHLLILTTIIMIYVMESNLTKMSHSKTEVEYLKTKKKSTKW